MNSNNQRSSSICPHHTGMFDIWPVMNKCTVVAKREILYVWPFGLAAWLCGLIFINRMQTEKSRDQLCTASDYIKSRNIKLWIFPEGTRRNTGEMHPFRKGAFHVALDAQLPILPVVFSSYRTFLDKKNKHFNSGKIIVSTLPPIQTQGLGKADMDALMQHTWDVMSNEYHRISNEVHDELRLVQQQQQHTKNASMTAAGNATSSTTGHNDHVPFLLEEPNVFNQYSFMPTRKSAVSTANGSHWLLILRDAILLFINNMLEFSSFVWTRMESRFVCGFDVIFTYCGWSVTEIRTFSQCKLRDCEEHTELTHNIHVVEGERSTSLTFNDFFFSSF